MTQPPAARPTAHDSPGRQLWPPLLTFTSDFGLTDVYVGVVHGVISRIAPEARVIDLTHGVPPQDVRAGALALFAGCRHFPSGTIHLAVVDPGVGTARRGLLLQTADSWFVGPDNGLFSLVAPPEAIRGCWELTSPHYWLEDVSVTFHGRDIFAPVAAHLATGVAPAALGTPTSSPLALDGLRLVEVATGEVRGSVLAVDHFGNLVTNLLATPLWRAALTEGTARAWLEDRPLLPVRTYGAAPPDRLALLCGSAGLLEVAVANGSAAAATALGPGASVRVAVQERGSQSP